MKKEVLIMFAFLIILGVNAQINQSSNDLSNSNYIFEGIIESVEFFAGDNNANKLPISSVVWENGIGYFYNLDGSDAKGYSLAKIKLYKVYKGQEIQGNDYLNLLTTSSGLQVFLSVNGQDTVVNHIDFRNPHDESFLITNSMKNYRMIFFANKTSNGNFVVKNKNSVIYFNSNYSNQATNELDAIYAGFEDRNFKSETELYNYLKTIPGVNIKAKEKFDLKKTQIFPTK